ncbi:Putative two-component system sensor kinase [Rhodococcus wratislaviensis]|uniref:Two-component system sensor kinase n=1 Tax=Rhodococcus wratislaviensis TaxID=44752 RepID=A0A402C7U4_RHOWR|nr:sensor histidine kinase [Rhodococcus wratislaviensis]GCE39587.1 Putative two-component system sensor kinase [Rhodococcus wratislaviensis]
MASDSGAPQRALSGRGLETSTSQESADRILRTFSRFVSAGYAFYLVMLLPDIVATAPQMAWWWTPVAVVLVFGSGLLLGVMSLRRSATWMRHTAAVAALSFLLVAFSWWFAWDGTQTVKHQGVWLSVFPGVASLAAAAAWPAWLAFGHLAVAVTTVMLINQAARDPSMNNPFLPDLVFGLMFCAIFVGATVMALRTGRLLDATRAATHAAAAGAASVEARTVERERFDALIHDDVMSSLLAASQGGSDPTVQRQARHTLGQLNSLRTASASDTTFDCDAVLAHFRAMATQVDENVAVRADVDPAAAVTEYPADAARAMGAALAEALRNSMRHAGMGARRALSVTITPAMLAVEVRDDGVGFDESAVPPHRLGVVVSIRARMQQLPGGAAVIETRPRAGTRVALSWMAPA